METDRNAAQTEKRKRVPQSQKAWKYIRDVNNTELADLSAPALIDGNRTYTYGLMFREWERYASVFSALGMTGEKGARVGLLGSTSAEAAANGGRGTVLWIVPRRRFCRFVFP